jgi:Putative beta-barrel porin-2, OmpL-like. bbp2
MKWLIAFAVLISVGVVAARAQAAPEPSREELNKRIEKLESEVDDLKQVVAELQSRLPAADRGSSAVAKMPATVNAPLVSAAAASSSPPIRTVEPVPTSATAEAVPVSQATAEGGAANSEDRKTLDFLRDTTLDLELDTYYEYNFNSPVGRVNLLRAYDVLSNEFSLNQADVILDHEPDVASGRRWGARLDLQFGQATDTLQGNPANEPRPEIYRNIFQAYGTYVVPLGTGLNVDFGKWSSSLGIEGNYTKDQINYSRSFWFTFLPYYHMGARVSYPVNDRFSLNYWIVNGTNQVEATNGFKDELFGWTAKPAKSVTWTMNYYLGQDHPDRATATSCGPAPVQPGLCFAAILPAPNGLTHIFDNYVTWQATPKLTTALEGDYFIQRLWRNAAPGMSSAPLHTDGGAGYVQYQLTPRLAFGARGEYMSDRGALFSGISQSLKEGTVTLKYQLTDGLLMFYEFRRDFSNQATFLSDIQGIYRKDQNTATLGLVWWWGRKQGAW